MYWQKRFDRENPDEKLEAEIIVIFRKVNETYGYRRMTAELKNRGYVINHKKVRRLMIKLGLKSSASPENHVSTVPIKELWEN